MELYNQIRGMGCKHEETLTHWKMFLHGVWWEVDWYSMMFLSFWKPSEVINSANMQLYYEGGSHFFFVFVVL